MQSTGAEIIDQIASAFEGLAGKAALAASAMTVAFAGVATAAVGMAADYQTTLNQIQNNTTLTDADVGQMSDTIKKMALDSGASLKDLGDGYMHITNLGFGAADAQQVLKAAMESARSTGAQTADVANVLANVMHEFGMQGSQAANAMDVLHLAAAQGNMTLEQLVENGGQAIAMAANLGVSYTEVSAALSALTRHGFDAAQAGTQVKDMLTHIVNPAVSAQKEIALLAKTTGVDLKEDFTQAGLAAKGLPGVLDDIQRATAGDSSEIMKLIPNMRGGLATMVLTGTGAQDLTDILGTLNDTWAGRLTPTADAYQRTLQTLQTQLDRVKVAFQEALIQLGEKLLPVLTPMVEWFANVLPTAFEECETALGGLASAFGTAMNGIISAVSAAVSTVWTLLQMINPFSDSSANSKLVDDVNLGLQAIGQAYGTLPDAISGPIQDANTAVKSLGSAIEDSGKQGESALKSLQTTVGSVVDAVKGNIADLQATVSDLQDQLSELDKGDASYQQSIIDQKKKILDLQVQTDQGALAAAKDKLTLQDQIAKAEDALSHSRDRRSATGKGSAGVNADAAKGIKDQEAALADMKLKLQQMGDGPKDLAAKLSEANLQLKIMQEQHQQAIFGQQQQINTQIDAATDKRKAEEKGLRAIETAYKDIGRAIESINAVKAAGGGGGGGAKVGGGGGGGGAKVGGGVGAGGPTLDRWMDKADQDSISAYQKQQGQIDMVKNAFKPVMDMSAQINKAFAHPETIVQTFVKGIGDAFAKADWSQIGQNLVQNLQKVFTKLDLGNTLVPFVQNILNGFRGLDNTLASSLGELIGKGLVAAIGAAVDFFKTGGLLKLGEVIVLIVAKLAELAIDIVASGVDLGAKLVAGLVKGITGKDITVDIWGWVQKHVIQPIKDALGIHSPSTIMQDEVGAMIPQGIWLGIEAGAGQLFSGLGTFVQKNIIDNVKQLLGIASPSTVFSDIGKNLVDGLIQGLETLGSALEKALVNPIKAAVNLAIDALNGLGKAISAIHISIPATPFTPALDFQASGFTIPHMADGGIVTSPTLALIGEAGPEAVIPLPGLGGGFGGNQPIIVNFNIDASSPWPVSSATAEAIGQQLEPLVTAAVIRAQRMGRLTLG